MGLITPTKTLESWTAETILNINAFQHPRTYKISVIYIYIYIYTHTHTHTHITKGLKFMKVCFSQNTNTFWNHKTQYMIEGRISYHKEEEEIIFT